MIIVRNLVSFAICRKIFETFVVFYTVVRMVKLEKKIEERNRFGI